MNMHTQMTDAMTAAGIRPIISRMQRVWTTVYNSKLRITSSDVAKILKESNGNVSSLLSQMEQRGMVDAVYNNKGVKEYGTIGDKYELLPVRKVATTPAKWRASMPILIQDKVFDVDSLTISEARALYRKLKPMFEGEK